MALTLPEIRALEVERAVFVVRGGELVESSAYRANLQAQWQAALRGQAPASALGDAATASATAYACLTYRADTISGLPLMVIDPTKDELAYHPLMWTLANLGAVIWYIDSALNTYGKAYVRKLYNDAGLPTSVQFMHPDCVEREEKADGVYYRCTIDNPRGGEPEECVLPEKDVILIPLQSLGNERRPSPLAVALTRVGAEQGVVNFQAAFFLNSARPDGMLISKKAMNPEERAQAKMDWKQFQSAENAHRTFVQSGDWEWVAITPPLIDLAMDSVVGQISGDICKILQVNPVLIGAASASDPLSAQSTFKQIERHHVESIAIPRLERILSLLNEQWLWVDFPQKRHFTLAVARARIALLSDANTENASTAQVISASGVGTFDEARRVLGLPEDDTYLTRDPTQVLAVFNSGMVYADEARALVGLRPLPFGKGKYVLIAGKPVLLKDIDAYAALSLQTPPAPASPFSFQMSAPPALDMTALANLIRAALDEKVAPLQAQIDALRQTPQLPASRAEEVRAVDTAVLMIDLAGNAFVRYCKRILSDVLTQRGVLDTAWLSEDDWCVPLISVAEAAPGDVKRMVAHLDASALDKCEMTLSGYTVRDGTLFACLKEQPAIDALCRGLLDQCARANVSGTPLTPYCIPLGHADLPDGDIPGGHEYPLVGQRLVMRYRSTMPYMDELRRYTPEQVKELDNWKHVATRKGPRAKFAVRSLPAPVARFVRTALRMGGEARQVFGLAHQLLRGDFDAAIRKDQAEPTPQTDQATPDEYDLYWAKYDALQKELGSDWLNGYMGRAWDTVKPGLRDGVQPGEVINALRQHHDDIRAEWVGTPDKPGVLTKLIRAGMAAAQDSAVHHSSADYRSVLRAVNLDVSWDQMDKQSYDFAGRYAYTLIRGLDQTTQANVQKAMQTWIERGAPLTDLEDDLYGVFNDRSRAEMIAQTESTRVYNEGARERWGAIGVTRVIWETVRDSHVCPICQPLHGKVAELNGAGHEHPGGIVRDDDGNSYDGAAYAGKAYRPPAHPRCRCFQRPDMSSGTMVDDLIAEIKGGESSVITPDAPPPDKATRRAKAQALPLRDALDEWKDDLDQHVTELVKVQVRRTEIESELTEQRSAHRALVNQTLDISDEVTAKLSEYYRLFPDTTTEEAQAWKQANVDPIQTQRAEIWKQADAIEAEMNARIAERDSLNAQYGRSLGAASAALPIKAEYNTTYKKGSERRQRSDSAVDWLRETFDGDAYPADISVNLVGLNGRAHYNGRTKTIAASTSNGVDVFVHEWGHALEDADPGIAKRAQEFLEARTANESARPLAAIKPGYAYDPTEIAKPDGFPDPYVGKQYKVGNKTFATEIMSMGLQYLYTDPVAFYQADPDYFRFVVSIVKGYIA